MKHFLRRLALFGLFMAPLLFVAQWFFVNVVRAYHLHSDTEFWSSTAEVQTLVIGDSHPERGFDTHLVPGSFSLTTSGENYLQTFYKLKSVLSDPQRGADIERVVVPFDLHSLSSFRRNRFLFGSYWDRFIDWRELEGVPGFGSEERVRRIRNRLLPYVGNWGMVLEWLESLASGGPEPFRGYVAEEGAFPSMDPETRQTRAFRRARLHLRGADHADPLMLEYLGRIVELCRDHGVDLVLVTFPVSREYLAAAVDSFGADSTLARGRLVVREKGSAPILNYLSLLQDEPQLFMDPDHLNGAGAQAFSEILAKDLEALRSGEPHPQPRTRAP